MISVLRLEFATRSVAAGRDSHAVRPTDRLATNSPRRPAANRAAGAEQRQSRAGQDGRVDGFLRTYDVYSTSVTIPDFNGLDDAFYVKVGEEPDIRYCP